MGERETLNQRWAALLAASFARAGVKHVVVAPGSRSTPLTLAFADRSDVSCWPVIDERVAAFFALGLAKGAGQPVVVLCTSGTAGAHFLPAVIEAHESGWPVWVLTADRPWELHGFGAAQTIDQRGLFGRYVEHEAALPTPEDSPEVFRHLAALISRLSARAGRAPMHVNVPFREPLAPESSAVRPVVPLDQLETTSFVHSVKSPDVSSLVPMLERAERGVIVCGPREQDDGFGAWVHQLGAHLGFPVLAEAVSNARYGFESCVSMYDTMWRNERFSRAKPDVMLRFGGGLTPRSMIQLSAPVCLHVSDEGRVFDPAHQAQQVIIGEAPGVCEALLSQTRRSESGSWRGSWLEAERRTRLALASLGGLSEPLIARDVVAALPMGSNLVLSSSMPIRDVDAFAPVAKGALRVFSNRGVNGIDGVTSTALGIAVGSGRPTTLLIGDVAFLHDLSAWVLAKQLRASLTVVLVNNDGGGIFHFLPVADRTTHFERFFGTPHGVDVSHVAALAGASMSRPADPRDLVRTLTHALEGGLHLIELKTARTANVVDHRALFTSLAEHAS